MKREIIIDDISKCYTTPNQKSGIIGFLLIEGHLEKDLAPIGARA
jgi:hypothetical protein